MRQLHSQRTHKCSGTCLDRREHVQQLDDAPAEQVELSKDFRDREIKLARFGQRRELLLRLPKLLLVTAREQCDGLREREGLVRHFMCIGVMANAHTPKGPAN